jgi:hypothetical protein
MKELYPCLFMILILTGCHQLDTGEAEDVSEEPVNNILKPGESRNYEIFYSEENPLILELSDIPTAGIYVLSLSSRSDGAHFIDLEIGIHHENSCPGPGDYLLLSDSHRDEHDNFYHDLLFELEDTANKFVKIYHDDRYADNVIFNISFQDKTGPIVDPFPDYDEERELFLDTSLSGCFSRFTDDPADKFILKGLETDKIYKLSVDYYYDNCIFYIDDYFNIYESFYYSVIEKEDFDTKDRYVVYLSTLDPLQTVFELEGVTGISYAILLEEELKDFTDDGFEPDNGPISPSPETITDTGWDQFEGSSHTILEDYPEDDVDWIKFTPLADTTYRTYIILQDAWYDLQTQDDFRIWFDIELVRPNGYEREEDYDFYFDQVPINPVESVSYLYWYNSGDLIGEWFLRISSGSCCQYAVKIVKVP